jgi:hypothetical protein
VSAEQISGLPLTSSALLFSSAAVYERCCSRVLLFPLAAVPAGRCSRGP